MVEICKPPEMIKLNPGSKVTVTKSMCETVEKGREIFLLEDFQRWGWTHN